MDSLAPAGKDGLAVAGVKAGLGVSFEAMSRVGLGPKLVAGDVAAEGELVSGDVRILHLLQVICNLQNQLVFV